VWAAWLAVALGVIGAALGMRWHEKARRRNAPGRQGAARVIFPARPERPVDLGVTLGPATRSPLVLGVPLWIEPPRGRRDPLLRVALAQAATAVGAALAAGPGAFLPEERADAARWVLRWGRGALRHGPGVLALADMVEIPVRRGGPATVPAAAHRPLPRRIRRRSPAMTPVRPRPRPARPLAAWIRAVRRVHPDVPVALRLTATEDLEAHLFVAAALEADVITLEVPAPPDRARAEIGRALGRARAWLALNGLTNRLQLVALGVPPCAEDILAMLRRGADAVGVDCAALTRDIRPTTPVRRGWPTRLMRRSGRMDLDQAALQATRRLLAVRDDLAAALRALGVDSVRALRTENVAYALAGPDVPPPPLWLRGQLAALVALYQVAASILQDLAALAPRLYGMTASHPRPPRYAQVNADFAQAAHRPTAARSMVPP
jgi:hypothetical protein